jgi:DNA-directed RNA polymerase specialized sigma24 family protein
MDDITLWIGRLAAGNEQAAQAIWERYYRRLLAVARAKLVGRMRRAADEEDIVLSAFHSFFGGVAAGRFPQLDDRHDLWRVLLTLTAWKAASHIRRECSEKHGGGNLRGESVFLAGAPDDEHYGIDQVLSAEPTPEFAALAIEQLEHLLDRLADPMLRDIALRKLEGFTNQEIATALDCGLRTVERKIERIRAKWDKETPPRP